MIKFLSNGFSKNVLIPLNRVVLLNQPGHIRLGRQQCVLIPLNRVVLLNSFTISYGFFLLRLNPLESGRVVKSYGISCLLKIDLRVLIPLNRVVLLNVIWRNCRNKPFSVLIPLNRVVLLNQGKWNPKQMCLEGLNPLESGRVVKLDNIYRPTYSFI